MESDGFYEEGVILTLTFFGEGLQGGLSSGLSAGLSGGVDAFALLWNNNIHVSVQVRRIKWENIKSCILINKKNWILFFLVFLPLRFSSVFFWGWLKIKNNLIFNYVHTWEFLNHNIFKDVRVWHYHLCVSIWNLLLAHLGISLFGTYCANWHWCLFSSLWDSIWPWWW